MRLLAQLTLALYGDLNKVKKRLEEPVVIDDTDMESYQSGEPVLEAGGSVALDFGSVDVGNCLVILAHQEVEVTINGADTPFTLEPLLAEEITDPISSYQEEDQPGVLFIKGRAINSVTVSNPSGTDTASFFYMIVGTVT